VRGWCLVVGGWWLVVGGWWLVVGGWWLVVGQIIARPCINGSFKYLKILILLSSFLLHQPVTISNLNVFRTQLRVFNVNQSIGNCTVKTCFITVVVISFCQHGFNSVGDYERQN
jgi:hypothetical protein